VRDLRVRVRVRCGADSRGGAEAVIARAAALRAQLREEASSGVPFADWARDVCREIRLPLFRASFKFALARHGVLQPAELDSEDATYFAQAMTAFVSKQRVAAIEDGLDRFWREPEYLRVALQAFRRSERRVLNSAVALFVLEHAETARDCELLMSRFEGTVDRRKVAAVANRAHLSVDELTRMAGLFGYKGGDGADEEQHEGDGGEAEAKQREMDVVRPRLLYSLLLMRAREERAALPDDVFAATMRFVAHALTERTESPEWLAAALAVAFAPPARLAALAAKLPLSPAFLALAHVRDAALSRVLARQLGRLLPLRFSSTGGFLNELVELLGAEEVLPRLCRAVRAARVVHAVDVILYQLVKLGDVRATAAVTTLLCGPHDTRQGPLNGLIKWGDPLRVLAVALASSNVVLHDALYMILTFFLLCDRPQSLREYALTLLVSALPRAGVASGAGQQAPAGPETAAAASAAAAAAAPAAASVEDPASQDDKEEKGDTAGAGDKNDDDDDDDRTNWIEPMPLPPFIRWGPFFVAALELAANPPCAPSVADAQTFSRG
jgi:hypothetical protein